jgi:hypothetical protein
MSGKCAAGRCVGPEPSVASGSVTRPSVVTVPRHHKKGRRHQKVRKREVASEKENKRITKHTRDVQKKIASVPKNKTEMEEKGCTKSADCAAGLYCHQSVCLPLVAPGSKCERPGSCANNAVCYNWICTRKCSDNGTCPEGYSCVAAGTSGNLCLPTAIPVTPQINGKASDHLKTTKDVISLTISADKNALDSENPEILPSYIFIPACIVVLLLIILFTYWLCRRMFRRRTQRVEIGANLSERPASESVIDDTLPPIPDDESPLPPAEPSPWNEPIVRISSPTRSPPPVQKLPVKIKTTKSRAGLESDLAAPTPEHSARPSFYDEPVRPNINIPVIPEPFIDDVPHTPIERREFASPMNMSAPLHVVEMPSIVFKNADHELDSQEAWSK